MRNGETFDFLEKQQYLTLSALMEVIVINIYHYKYISL